MRPLKVALLHIAGPRTNESRMVGVWSYDVPEFEVTHFNVDKYFIKSTAEFADFDVIWVEDKSCFGSIIGSNGPLKCYYVTDSTLSGGHFKARHRAAMGYDFVFVDWDRLERFGDIPGKVRRCGYCVNDKLFMDYGLDKTIDVYFPNIRKGEGAPDRQALDRKLSELCKTNGLVYDNTIRPGQDYARALNRSRIVVNLARNDTTRSHRIFDTMASRSCVVCDPLPDVSGEFRESGTHYLVFHNWQELERIILESLDSKLYATIADNAYQMALSCHTWRVRATELRGELDKWTT